MLIPEGGIWRFCSECLKEGTAENPASWSAAFGKRLCMDCYNAISEAFEAQEIASFEEN